MKGFLILVVGGAVLCGLTGGFLNASGETAGYWALGGIGAFLGAKFGLIIWVGWIIACAYAEDDIDQKSGGKPK